MPNASSFPAVFGSFFSGKRKKQGNTSRYLPLVFCSRWLSYAELESARTRRDGELLRYCALEAVVYDSWRRAEGRRDGAREEWARHKKENLFNGTRLESRFFRPQKQVAMYLRFTYRNSSKQRSPKFHLAETSC